MYLYMLIIPGVTFPAVMFTLVNLRVGVSGDNESGAYLPSSFLLLSLQFFYLLFVWSILITTIVVTIRTWKRVRDNIHVRGELICQGVILCLVIVVQFLVYSMDQMDGETEIYDECVYFGYFTNATIASFASIIVSTQYVRFKVLQQNQMRKNNSLFSLRPSLQNVMKQTGIDRFDVDFPALISTNDGLQAFMSFLAKRAELNYLVVKCLWFEFIF